MGFRIPNVVSAFGNRVRNAQRMQEIARAALNMPAGVSTSGFPAGTPGAEQDALRALAQSAAGSAVGGRVLPGGIVAVQTLSRGIQPAPDGNITPAQRAQIIQLLELSRQQGIAQGRLAGVVRSTSRLSDTDAGGDRLRTYISPQRRAPVLENLNTTIQPVQELREFQWQYFESGVTVPVNAQQASVSIVTPDDECWEVQYLTGRSTFASQTRITLVHTNQVISHNIAVVEMLADITDLKTMVFGDNAQKGITGPTRISEWRLERLVMLPGDRLGIITVAAPAAAHTFAVQMRWRLRPLPKTFERSELLQGVAV